MNDDGYRSYVIRVRRRPGTTEGVPESQTRLDVEDLLEGRTATVSGDFARSLANSLEKLVESARTSSDAALSAAEPTPGS